MIKVYLLRHGQTTWNADNNRYCGRTDIGLTEKGLQQAAEVREQLAGIEWAGVYSSPLQRARITAEIASGLPVQTDERLIEADFGKWEGRTKEEFLSEIPESWNNWMRDPANYAAGETGETGSQIVHRVDDFFQELSATTPHGNVLVVAHNGVNRLYMAYKLGMPLGHYRRFVQENASVTRFELSEDGILTLELLNSKLR